MVHSPGHVYMMSWFVVFVVVWCLGKPGESSGTSFAPLSTACYLVDCLCHVAGCLCVRVGF